MRGFKVLCICILYIASFSASAYAIDSLKYLKAKLKTYSTENPTTNLYLHLDKNIYAQNDNIWFKAYLLASGNLNTNTTDNKVLYVRLVDENKKMIVKAQFPMYNIMAHGNLEIPETVKDGDYTLYAFTDRMINFKAKDAFIQHITIKREEFKPLQAEASVTDTNKLRRGEKVQIIVRVKDEDILASGIKGTYQLLDGAKIIKAGFTTTNFLGEGFIDFVYPQIADDKILRVKINFKRKTDFAEVLLNLKHEGNTLSIKAHPEGGRLIAGVPVKMVINAKDINGNAAVTAFDMSDGTRSIARFNTDKYGEAMVKFTPLANKRYTFNYTISGVRKSVGLKYPIEEKGYTVLINEVKGMPMAIVKNIGENPDALIIVRAMDQVIGTEKVNIPPGDSLCVDLPVNKLPKEILSVGVFDTVGTLLSERTYSNKRADGYHVSVNADAKTYSAHQKVTLTVNVTDTDNNPVTTNFSVAVIEKSSIDRSKYLTINQQYDYRSLNGNIETFARAKTAADIDMALITRGFNNSWQSVNRYTPIGGIKLLENTGGVTGKVYLNYELKEPPTNKEIAKLLDTTRLLLKSDMGITPVKVKPDHTISIPPNSLLTTVDDEIRLFKSVDFKTKFHVILDIPDRVFDVKVQDSALSVAPLTFSALSQSKPMPPKLPYRKVTALREVKIGNKENTGENFTTGECYDYVCSFGGLYCPRHKPGMPGSEANTKPVPGQMYVYASGTKAIYYGCGDFRFKSITSPKTFNAPDYGKDQNAEPVFGTTIYWNPNTTTADSGSGTVTFYTSDLPGDYNVIIQGVDAKTLKPIYGTASFSVK